MRYYPSSMRTGLISAAAALAIAGAGAALAQNPHFVSATDSVDNNGDLVVKWKEAGLGDNVKIDYLLNANATATYQCVNKGGNCPKAANKQQVAGPVSSEGSFTSGKNGQITGSLTASPPPSTLSCPGGQHEEVAVVNYTNVLLTDTTNGISESLPDVSKQGFVCP